MRYVQINAYSNGWADSIIFNKHRELQAQGHESWVFWARGKHEQDSYMRKIASCLDVGLDVFLTRLDGRPGFHSKRVTRRLLRRLDEINPDVVHLHLLLGYYINIEMLFEWLYQHRCKVIWTLHDCWAFTGHCIYFTCAGCTQWLTHCAASAHCPQKGEYPKSWFAGDGSVRQNYDEKKRLFTLLPRDRLSLVTPSYWLADFVAQSFLSKYSITVVGNPVNTDVFKPTPSDFRRRFSIGNRFMVLGVASNWSNRKGLTDFDYLARELNENDYAVVVVGLSKKQIARMPDQLIALQRTNNLEELAEIYSSADVLLNLSVEETYGMNVAEAAACGTPSIVRKGSACAEVARNALVVSDLDEAVSKIKGLKKRKSFT